MQQTVSLIIPIFNEAMHLERFLNGIDKLGLPLRKELVIINDCSTDNSAEILENFQFQSRVIFINQSRNQGKGAAIRVGIQQATGDFPKLLMPLLEGKADVVYGSRFKKTNYQVHRTPHYLVNRTLTMLSNMMSGLYLSDMETCYKFFRADVIKNINLESNRFGFEPEITAKIARLQLRIMELPISYFPRKYLEGKKITWKDGVAALRHLFYFNLVRKHKDCFYETLPDHYRIKGEKWL